MDKRDTEGEVTLPVTSLLSGVRYTYYRCSLSANSQKSRVRSQIAYFSVLHCSYHVYEISSPEGERFTVQPIPDRWWDEVNGSQS